MNERQTEVTISYYLPENMEDPDPTRKRTYTVVTDNSGISEIIQVMDDVQDRGEDDEDE